MDDAASLSLGRWLAWWAVSAIAVGCWSSSFLLFCLGSVFLGLYQGTAMSYRYAALEAAPPEGKGRAASFVLAGGILAALLGPVLAEAARDVVPLPFIGAYGLMSLLAACAIPVLWGLPTASSPRVVPARARGVRWALLRRPAVRAAVLATACGHGVMILVMNVTPVSMIVCGHSTAAASWVIQAHVLGMFVPALFSGWLVDRLGAARIAAVGAVLLIISGGVAVAGSTLTAFVLSSLLLGAGWNIMLVAGTTLLGQGHSDEERPDAQGLMEVITSASAAVASLAAAVAVVGSGWAALNAGMIALVMVALIGVVWTASRSAVACAVSSGE